MRTGKMNQKQIEKLCEAKPPFIQVTFGELTNLIKYASTKVSVKDTLVGKVYYYNRIQLFVV